MQKWAKRILLISVLLLFPGTLFTLKLFNRLNPDLTALLSSDSTFLKDLSLARERTRSFEGIIILSSGSTAEQNRAFQRTLADELYHQLNPSQFKVKYEVKSEIDFFSKRKGLYLTEDEIHSLQKNLLSAINNRSAQSPAKKGFKQLMDTLKSSAELIKIRNRYASFLDRFIRFPDGLFATPDFSLASVIVQRASPTLGFEDAVKSMKGVYSIVQKVQQEKQFSGITVRYTGEIPSMIEDQVSIVSDIHRASAAVLLLIVGLLFFFFRDIKLLLALFYSVSVAIAVAFSITWFKFYSLNANSAFMASIVIGNGINFGIMILGHYTDTKFGGKTILDSLKANFAGTSMAALAAIVAYSVVAMTDFRGFHQFGVIGAIGTLCCWISAFTILPSFLITFGINKKIKEKEISTTVFFQKIGFAKLKKGATLLAIVTSLLSLALAIKVGSTALETDLSKLRDRKSIESGSIAAFKFADRIFGRSFTAPIILSTSREKAVEIASKLRFIETEDAKTAAISSALTLDDLIPANQFDRAKSLAALKRLTKGGGAKFLNPAEKQLLKDLSESSSYAGFTEADLPQSVKDLFSEADGTVGRIVLVDSPKLVGFSDLKTYLAMNRVLRQAIDSTDPGALLIGASVFVSEISEALMREIKRASIWVLIGVIASVFILFRNRREKFLILGSWALGLAWFVGTSTLLGIKINFINFLAVPITIGIGIDYIANLVKKSGKRSRSSDAVFICSLTTIIGYGSLLFAGNNGLRSFGQLAILGELCCITAAYFCFTLYAKPEKLDN